MASCWLCCGLDNYNGDFRAAFRVHAPQQVYGAETMVCALASNMDGEWDEIILNNQGPEQDYQDTIMS